MLQPSSTLSAWLRSPQAFSLQTLVNAAFASGSLTAAARNLGGVVAGLLWRHARKHERVHG